MSRWDYNGQKVKSLANFLRKTLRLPVIKIALRQKLAAPLSADPAALTRKIKSLPSHRCKPAIMRHTIRRKAKTNPSNASKSSYIGS